VPSDSFTQQVSSPLVESQAPEDTGSTSKPTLPRREPMDDDRSCEDEQDAIAAAYDRSGTAAEEGDAYGPDDGLLSRNPTKRSDSIEQLLPVIEPPSVLQEESQRASPTGEIADSSAAANCPSVPETRSSRGEIEQTLAEQSTRDGGERRRQSIGDCPRPSGRDSWDERDADDEGDHKSESPQLELPVQHRSALSAGAKATSSSSPPPLSQQSASPNRPRGQTPIWTRRDSTAYSDSPVKRRRYYCRDTTLRSEILPQLS
jgi:hypothetical protein